MVLVYERLGWTWPSKDNTYCGCQKFGGYWGPWGPLLMFLSPLVKYFKNRLKWKIEHSVISIQKKTSRAGKL